MIDTEVIPSESNSSLLTKQDKGTRVLCSFAGLAFGSSRCFREAGQGFVTAFTRRLIGQCQ